MLGTIIAKQIIKEKMAKKKCIVPTKLIINDMQNALKYVKERVLYGATELRMNDLSNERHAAIIHAMGIYHDIKDQHKKLLQFDSRLLFMQRLHLIEKYSIGNCQEQSHIALAFFILNNVQYPVEEYHIEGGDHVVLVINRDPDSKPEDYKTWNEDAYILDALNNTFFPASTLEKNLKNFSATERENNRYHIQYTSFDPKEHKFLPICFSVTWFKKVYKQILHDYKGNYFNGALLVSMRTVVQKKIRKKQRTEAEKTALKILIKMIDRAIKNSEDIACFDILMRWYHKAKPTPPKNNFLHFFREKEFTLSKKLIRWAKKLAKKYPKSFYWKPLPVSHNTIKKSHVIPK